MSYSLMMQCSFCKKRETCKDHKEIQKAVNEIHSKTYEEGHQGSGTIIVQCTRQETNY
jgi:hypothetical protein